MLNASLSCSQRKSARKICNALSVDAATTKTSKIFQRYNRSVVIAFHKLQRPLTAPRDAGDDTRTLVYYRSSTTDAHRRRHEQCVAAAHARHRARRDRQPRENENAFTNVAIIYRNTG
jgi:hypothetical protein